MLDGWEIGWTAASVVYLSSPYGNQCYLMSSLTFNVVINITNEGIKGTLSKFADDAKLSSAGDTSEEWDAIQRDVDNLKKYGEVNPKKFNKTKCKVLIWIWSNPQLKKKAEEWMRQGWIVPNWKVACLDQLLGRNYLQEGCWGTGICCPDKLCLPISESAHGLVGWSSGQFVLVEGVSVCVRGIGTRWFLKISSNLNHSVVLWFYVSMNLN